MALLSGATDIKNYSTLVIRKKEKKAGRKAEGWVRRKGAKTGKENRRVRESKKMQKGRVGEDGLTWSVFTPDLLKSCMY